ncbi:hypothetical protein [Pseudalkalibacillus salsuginis]|nr:hypothetical protein [Pseudalkalibacillus salsuginis]MCF6411626.1 hypothetical protein [Pseudalkalibacillus salsuginis]
MGDENWLEKTLKVFNLTDKMEQKNGSGKLNTDQVKDMKDESLRDLHM